MMSRPGWSKDKMADEGPGTGGLWDELEEARWADWDADEYED